MSWQDGDPLGMRLRIAPGATLSGNPSGYPWIDVTGDVAWDMPITQEFGSENEATETNSQITWTFRDNNGRYDVENAMSDLYGTWDVGTPVELAINLGDGSGWLIQGIGYVGAVGDDYLTAPNRVRRNITAGGLFRRIGQDDALLDTITRNMRSTKAVRYYRLEDGADSRYAVSDIAGQPAMTQGNVILPTFANRTGVPGSVPVASFTTGTGLAVEFPAYAPIGTSLWWQWLHNVRTLTTTNSLVTMHMSGSRVYQWIIFQVPGFCPQLRAFDSAGNIIYTSTAFGIQPGMVGDGNNRPDNHPWWWMSVKFTQSGADLVLDYRMTAQWIDANGAGQQISYILSGDTLTSTTLGAATGWLVANNGTVEDFACGHMGLFDSGVNNPSPTGYAAVVAWPQNAADRIAGVSNEAHLPNNVTASPTVVLGPQQSGSVLSLLRQASLADHGILDDSKGVVGYRGLYDLLNVTPTLTLDGSNREIFHPFAPVRDDQKLKNRVTVSRPGGSSATVDDPVSQARSGVYPDAPTLNLGSDADLVGHAQFGVTVGTVPGKRYPQVSMELHKATQLARAWSTMQLGDRFQVNNPPRGGTRVGVQLQLRGARQTWINRRVWLVQCNTVLADPYNVGVIEDPVLGRAEADSGSVTSQLDVDAVTTSFTVLTAAGAPLPVQSAVLPGDFPIPLLWDGEEISVTAIVGASSPQTFTAVRGVNGVHKIHKAGSVLKLKTPMRPTF